MGLNVLITGANSGFGLLTARKFAAEGWTVHAGWRNPDRRAGLDALAAELPGVLPIKLDVADDAGVRAAVAEASKDAPIDVLVNNAGFAVSGPVDQLSDASLTRQFDTNVLGVVRTIRAVSPAMRERRCGAIVNLSSVVGWLSIPYESAYAASKHAVEALSEALWFELAPFGVRVAVIEPGGFPTSFGDNIVADPAFTEASPHWPHAERFRTALHGLSGQTGAGADPREVADLIYEAATTTTPRLRWLAGNDARTFVPFYKGQEFEGFRDAILGRLGLGDWAAGA